MNVSRPPVRRLLNATAVVAILHLPSANFTRNATVGLQLVATAGTLDETALDPFNAQFLGRRD
ncbi:MAG: hypothetical protein JWP52_1499 [Rhizobacter sp.]|jgi:hypothetical protein|nr:hypothetical protein [Rhizobacter sp.]